LNEKTVYKKTKVLLVPAHKEQTGFDNKGTTILSLCAALSGQDRDGEPRRDAVTSVQPSTGLVSFAGSEPVPHLYGLNSPQAKSPDLVVAVRDNTPADFVTNFVSTNRG
jgi:hypothetical protein